MKKGKWFPSSVSVEKLVDIIVQINSSLSGWTQRATPVLKSSVYGSG